jgi:hypothetical protein
MKSLNKLYGIKKMKDGLNGLKNKAMIFTT